MQAGNFILKYPRFFFKTLNIIVLLSNDYCVFFWNFFVFNVADMEGIYTQKQVIILVTLV